MVSELMLQQTQVERVVPKYLSFLHRFPTTKALAQAKLADVLREWQGLGYNRRALYLKKTCELVEKTFAGNIVSALHSETKLPGIGPYTRHAIRTFAWDEPHIFIETNIRSVYIHHFFPKKKKVSDDDLLSYMRETLDTENPREWYWALMDYGSHLKRTVTNPSRKSTHHVKQSKFAGSNRELRSHILKELLKAPQSIESLHQIPKRPLLDIDKNLRAMKKEGLLSEKKRIFSIK
jgi:A/G-specific adenine glycosylase